MRKSSNLFFVSLKYEPNFSKSKYMRFLIIAITVVLLSSFIEDKPRILIIGDSISIGYTPFVREGLVNEAGVFHNPGNAQHTGIGLKKIEEWIGEND